MDSSSCSTLLSHTSQLCLISELLAFLLWTGRSGSPALHRRFFSESRTCHLSCSMHDLGIPGGVCAPSLGSFHAPIPVVRCFLVWVGWSRRQICSWYLGRRLDLWFVGLVFLSQEQALWQEMTWNRVAKPQLILTNLDFSIQFRFSDLHMVPPPIWIFWYGLSLFLALFDFHGERSHWETSLPQ